MYNLDQVSFQQLRKGDEKFNILLRAEIVPVKYIKFFIH